MTDLKILFGLLKLYIIWVINYNQINSEQGVKYSVLPDTCVQ